MIFDDTFQTEDVFSDFAATNRFESSYTLGEIMEQKSISALNTTTLNNSNINAMAQGAEKSSNNLLVPLIAKKSAVYVLKIQSIL
jgi:hypothetical protein